MLEVRRSARASAVLLVGVVLAGLAGWATSARAGDDAALPAVAIERDGRTIELSLRADAAGTYRATSPDADLELRRAGGEEWELVVRAKRDLSGVWFPRPVRSATLDPASPATVLLYPMMLGVAVQAPSAAALGLDWRTYPGECFAPLLVLADARRSEMVAATNWPPRSVVPVFADGGLGMRYREVVPAGQERRYRALIARRSGDEADGRAPWLLATLAYREWLRPNLESAGLLPGAPQWILDSDGWQNVQLQNLVDFDPGALEQRWRRWKDLLPWMQLWGQMSDYAGRRTVASTLGLGEEVGCCMDRLQLHPRYQDGLAGVVADVAARGRVGLYARPRSPYARLDGDGAGAAERRFLLGWLALNRDQLGANAFYVDVLGHCWFGEPIEVARFVRDQLPPATVVEYAVDVYPRPALVSGSLTGGSFGGGPTREPRELGALATARTTFPRFGRAVLAEHTLFLGESNGDHVFWGSANGHWAERQAFLLGAKLDAMRVGDGRDDPARPNEALRRIIAARRAADWWRRAPVYRDRLGISGVPDGVDVRRFRGSAGEDLLVVDNPGRRSGSSVRVDGRALALDAEPLSIRVVAAGA